MFRDSEPHILASIAAASTRVRNAEQEKRAADQRARAAQDIRDQERRILADRVVVAARNDVPQKLIAENANRTREWVRRTVLSATNPDEVTAPIYTSTDGSFRDWRVAAELAWLAAAHGKGLEPLVLDDFEPKGNEVAQVLVYDTRWTLLREDNTIRAFDPNYTPEKHGRPRNRKTDTTEK